MATTSPAARIPAIGPRLAAAPAAAPSTARTLVWRFLASGWTAPEAGNLVALAVGLRPVAAGWSVHEIEHLRFLRSLAQAGRIER